MTETARVWSTPAGVDLGPLDQIADGAARNFVLQMKAGRFHGFAVRRGQRIFGYVDRCPHAGLPLAQALDQYLTADRSHIVCSWHGALFEPDTETVLENVVYRLVGAQLFQALLDAKASEWSMRMLAMKNATDNASDVIDDLTLEMNKARQAAITQELAEISGGAEAMK